MLNFAVFCSNLKAYCQPSGDRFSIKSNRVYLKSFNAFTVFHPAHIFGTVFDRYFLILQGQRSERFDMDVSI